MSVLFAISGTYDGESIWYPINSELRNEHLSIIDMRSALEFRIGWKGKKVYAIQLLSSGCWLHELILLSDSYKRAGYAAFSIFIPNNKHVSGRSVKQLLDNAVAEYEKKCTDGCTIGIMDWQNFVKTHIPLDGLVVDSKSNQSRFTVGDNLNAPFAVVDNVADADVEKFFDNPFFQDFSSYKCVFLSSEFLKDDTRHLVIDINDIDLDIVCECGGEKCTTVPSTIKLSEYEKVKNDKKIQCGRDGFKELELDLYQFVLDEKNKRLTCSTSEFSWGKDLKFNVSCEGNNVHWYYKQKKDGNKLPPVSSNTIYGLKTGAKLYIGSEDCEEKEIIIGNHSHGNTVTVELKRKEKIDKPNENPQAPSPIVDNPPIDVQWTVSWKQEQADKAKKKFYIEFNQCETSISIRKRSSKVSNDNGCKVEFPLKKGNKPSIEENPKLPYDFVTDIREPAVTLSYKFSFSKWFKKNVGLLVVLFVLILAGIVVWLFPKPDNQEKEEACDTVVEEVTYIETPNWADSASAYLSRGGWNEDTLKFYMDSISDTTSDNYKKVKANWIFRRCLNNSWIDGSDGDTVYNLYSLKKDDGFNKLESGKQKLLFDMIKGKTEFFYEKVKSFLTDIKNIKSKSFNQIDTAWRQFDSSYDSHQNAANQKVTKSQSSSTTKKEQVEVDFKNKESVKNYLLEHEDKLQYLINHTDGAIKNALNDIKANVDKGVQLNRAVKDNEFFKKR